MKTMFFKLTTLVCFIAIIGFVACEKDSVKTPEASTVADFAYTLDNNTYAPCNASFTNKSLNALSYSWDFGNGKTSTEANPTTIYEGAGSYIVTLTVSGANNNLHYNKLTKSVNIKIKDKPFKTLYVTDRSIGSARFVVLDDNAPVASTFPQEGLFNKPYGIAIDTVNAKLYVTDTQGFIYVSELNGVNVQQLMSSETGACDSPYGIAVINGKLYWCDTGGIWRANLDGSNSAVLLNVPDLLPLCLTYNRVDNKIYFTNDGYENTGGIYSCNIDGTGLALVLEKVNGKIADGGGIAVDGTAGYLFFSDYANGLVRISLSDMTYTITDPSMINVFVWGVTVDEATGKVYYSKKASNTAADGLIVKSNYDGSSREEWLSNVGPFALAIDIAR